MMYIPVLYFSMALFCAVLLAYGICSFTRKAIDIRLSAILLLTLGLIYGVDYDSRAQQAFGAAKILTIFLPFILYYNRFSSIKFRNILQYSIPIILIINIIEAIIYAFQFELYLNAAAGIMILICTPRRGMVLDEYKSTFGIYLPIKLNTSYAWIAAYVAWNIAFTISYFGGLNLFNLLITLLIPAFLALRNPYYFIPLRAIGIAVNITIAMFLYRFMGIESARNDVFLVGHIPVFELVDPALNIFAICFVSYMIFAHLKQHFSAGGDQGGTKAPRKQAG